MGRAAQGDCTPYQTHRGNFQSRDSPYTQRYLPPFEDAARSFAAEPATAPVHSDSEIESAIAALAQSEGGIIVMTDPFTAVHRKVIVSLTRRYRVPEVATRILRPNSHGGTTFF